MKINENFSAVIVELKKKGLVKRNNEVAEVLGISPSGLTEIIKGRNMVTVQHIYEIAIKFDVNLDFIFFGAFPIICEKDNQPSYAQLLNKVKNRMVDIVKDIEGGN